MLFIANVPSSTYSTLLYPPLIPLIFSQVDYVADHHKGYQAQVSYKGKAQYPHKSGPAVTFKPSSGGYDHKPQPSYH